MTRRRITRTVLIVVGVILAAYAAMWLFGKGGWDTDSQAATPRTRVCDASGSRCARVATSIIEAGVVASVDVQNDAVAARGERCWTRRTSKTFRNKVGVALFGESLKKQFCTVRGVVYYAPPAESSSHVTRAGSLIGYDDKLIGTIEEFYSWRHNNVKSGHRSWRNYRFRQCLPGLKFVACVNNYNEPISIRAHGDGSSNPY